MHNKPYIVQVLHLDVRGCWVVLIQLEVMHKLHTHYFPEKPTENQIEHIIQTAREEEKHENRT